MKFSALYQSHDAMREPCFRLEIDGKTLENTPGARLLRIECELTSNRQAGMLCLKAALDPKDGHGAAWLEALQPGAVCALSLGYAGQAGNVFSGFLYDVMWDDPLGQEVILLDAVCLDVRGRLMLAACAGAGAKRNASQLIGDILGQPCCTQLSSRRTVQPPPEGWDLPLLHPGLSDYSVICRAADFFCYEFYAFGEELYFGKPRPESSPAVIFDGPNGLLRLSRRRTLAGQCAAVAVGGTDGKGERICARHPRRRDSGFGAARMAGALTGDLCQPEPFVRTMAQAKYLSEARMEQRQRRAGGLVGHGVGLPELRPGRFMEITGLGSIANGSYYVHTVRHVLDETGFESWFEAED